MNQHAVGFLTHGTPKLSFENDSFSHEKRWFWKIISSRNTHLQILLHGNRIFPHCTRFGMFGVTHTHISQYPSNQWGKWSPLMMDHNNIFDDLQMQPEVIRCEKTKVPSRWITNDIYFKNHFINLQNLEMMVTTPLYIYRWVIYGDLWDGFLVSGRPIDEAKPPTSRWDAAADLSQGSSVGLGLEPHRMELAGSWSWQGQRGFFWSWELIQQLIQGF